jgi:DNA-binding response OmpR family regulator
MAKILVVDDAKSIRNLLKSILENDGHEVEKVATGIRTLEVLLEKNEFDLVLLDIGLPDINGLEVMKKLNEIGCEKPAICFVTGQQDQKIVGLALALGGVDFIVKPIDILVFREKMRKLLGGDVDTIAKIKTNLKAEILESPDQVYLTIIELSELGLLMTSSRDVKENSFINVLSKTLERLTGEDFTLPCLVQSVTKRERENVFEIECDFVGFHESKRQKIRQLTIRGKQIRD